MKTFPDAAKYTAEIRRLVPGYDLLPALTAATLQGLSVDGGTLAVVGSGPGHELLQLATALPDTTIHAFEPAPAMAQAAQEVVSAAGLGRQVSIIPATLPRLTAPRYDAAISLLVAHLIPDDGARAAFWGDLAAALRPGAPLLLAEIDEVDALGSLSWLAWSSSQGCSPAQLDRLSGRLRGGFALLPLSRTRALAEQAGLSYGRTVASALGVSLRLWHRRPAHGAAQTCG